MNYEKTGSSTACEEILDELPVIFTNFVIDLEEEKKCLASKYALEIKILEDQIAEYQKIQTKTAEKKSDLKKIAVEIQNENNSSFFMYSEKELRDELKYNQEVIKYAKSKIKLYEICEKIIWDPDSFAGTIVRSSNAFDLNEMSTFDQVNSVWDLLD
jgi:hypothetical protein